jgi:hypothetical protein
MLTQQLVHLLPRSTPACRQSSHWQSYDFPGGEAEVEAAAIRAVAEAAETAAAASRPAAVAASGASAAACGPPPSESVDSGACGDSRERAVALGSDAFLGVSPAADRFKVSALTGVAASTL